MQSEKEGKLKTQKRQDNITGLKHLCICYIIVQNLPVLRLGVWYRKLGAAITTFQVRIQSAGETWQALAQMRKISNRLRKGQRVGLTHNGIQGKRNYTIKSVKEEKSVKIAI